jgi:hypothetical protein
MVCWKMKVLYFIFFSSGCGFLKQQKKTPTKAKWQGGTHLKQVVDEACSNVEGCKTITMSSLKPTKIVNEKE